MTKLVKTKLSWLVFVALAVIISGCAGAGKDFGSDEYRCANPSSQSRPYFAPKQVRNIAEIKEGAKLFSYSRHYSTDTDVTLKCRIRVRLLEVVREPYLRDGEWFIDVSQDSVGLRRTNLASHSVVPHKNGLWDMRSWLEHR